MRILGSALWVTLAVAPVSGLPISYTEGWEYTGTTDPAYETAWAANPSREAVATAYYRTGTHSLLIDNGSSYASKGMTHLLPQPVKGTDASPLTLSTYMIVQASGHRQYLDFTLELASGDVVTPASGAANVVAIGRSLTYNGQNARFFTYTGDGWYDTGDAISTYSASGPGTKWWKSEITVNSTQLLWTLTSDTGGTFTDTFPLPASLQGLGFDRINIRHPGAANSNTHVAYIDDLSLTGGELVPEPAGLVLLALGGLLFVRRQKA
jgi:hypothetical protein